MGAWGSLAYLLHYECDAHGRGAGRDSCLVSCPQVALRIRPLNDAELEEGATVIAHKVGDQVRL